ncbi:Ni,Fe-hydrogenase I large subunit [Frankia canadensis]|uniref:Ni,Fe-hydrogenase I large subunit n=1 Tax=Frankia canadensis TaxID=1836972 RepID=A0A2I2KNN8_9ACTN|nr:nickel-dependent hydrogenase large subunit [Frankia canadensis]SNQ47266.1 Ni,Fe-hydrogenase I large subunit [Frankia canadensis]SOU54556.1 Ni,Fe-hydrogenase I large subunit [Frankia canadensis]
MTTVDLNVSPMGRVEGDLDVRVTIDDGVVSSAWTSAAMFRGLEIILRGKDPQAGLIVTPRICGICGGSHLYKAAYALDVAWHTELPPGATLVRNIAQACETLQSIPRGFYALFAIDLTHRRHAASPLYEEAVRRFTPFTGSSYGPGVVLSAAPVEIYAIFGGQWPHSSFMVPGGVIGAPTLADVTRATAILEHWRSEWLEKRWLGCSVDRWLANRSWADVLAWIYENESQHDSDCGFFLRYCLDVGLDRYGQGTGDYLASGTYFDPELYARPTIEGRGAALISRSGVYADGAYHPFDQARVREDVTHSYYRGSAAHHPFEGETDPIDPERGREAGKYSWAKSPRYDVPDLGVRPLEAGPLARRVAAAAPDAAAHQDHDPLFGDILATIGPSVMVRVLARMHEAARTYRWVRGWLDQLDLHAPFHVPAPELADGRGFGATEAARGSLADWIVLERGRIANYQVITPTAWNIGPRDGDGTPGPIEAALVGTPVADPSDPVELGHVARSFDSCLVCTVHAFDGRTGRELSRFTLGESA